MSDAQIAEIRRFNRFHTRLTGALGDRLLATGYGLPQLRVFYEIATAAPGQAPSGRDLALRLGMDPGHVSRIVAGLVRDGLVARTPSPGNARRLALTPTPAGRDRFAGIDRAQAEEVAALIAPLSPAERRELTGAMTRIRRLLGDAPADRTFVLRDPEPGDLGHVVAAQARLYAEEYGWDWTFEGLVAGITADYVRDHDPASDRCWIAEVEGQIAGSVFVVRQDAETAKLRMLYVDRAARGLGLGRRLVEECLRFARARGYRRMVLWTNDCLVSARRIYEAAGFELLEEDPHHSFGVDLVGQVWGRDL